MQFIAVTWMVCQKSKKRVSNRHKLIILQVSIFLIIILRVYIFVNRSDSRFFKIIKQQIENKTPPLLEESWP